MLTLQATTRLVNCADWEQTSRLRVGQARHQRESSQVASALQTEPPCTLQQEFAGQLKEEHEHVQKALSDSSAQRADIRRVLLQQAKDRAEERERERAQVNQNNYHASRTQPVSQPCQACRHFDKTAEPSESVHSTLQNSSCQISVAGRVGLCVQAAEAREVQRYARDSTLLRERAAVQLQSAISAQQQLQVSGTQVSAPLSLEDLPSSMGINRSSLVEIAMSRMKKAA